MSNSEIHIIIIWEKGLEKLSHIIYDLENSFKVLDVKKNIWNKKNFSNNLSRFYGEKLPDGSFKEKHCGNGPFISVIIKQDNPIYEKRKTSRGVFLVNSNLYDKKQLYRQWTGGGHKVHTSNDVAEANHDMFFIFGTKSSSYLEIKNWNKEIKEYNSKVKGVDGWKNFDDMFSFINKLSDYVILRNYKEIDSINANDSDIDFLTKNKDFSYHINGFKKHKNKARSAFSIKIGSINYSADVRYLSDGYYDSKWVDDIIKNRVLYEDRFFIPCPEDEFFSLLYHSLIHKNKMSDQYLEKLIYLSEKNNLNHNVDLLKTRQGSFEILDQFMNDKKYRITSPNDYSVQFNYANKGLKRWAWETIGKIKNVK